MTIAGFVVRNALRNKRRLLLTILSVALSLFLFTTLQTALRELTQPAATEDSATRLIVRHRVSLGNVLPQRYLERLERMPGVAVVSRFTWFGGIYQDEKNFFPQFAVDADRIFRILTEARIDPRQLEAFVKDRTACVVGRKTLERFGWKLGDRITLRGTIWGCDPELTIRGLYEGGVDETNMFFHHDYLDELMGQLGLTGCFWLQARSADVIPALIDRIDAAFRNSDAETKTETERAFVLNFVSMMGNVKTLIGSISAVIVFTMILVTAATMSMAVRERAREIAVLKALGFDGARVAGLLLAESFGLSMAGGVLGCAGGWMMSRIDIVSLTRGMFVKFEVTPHILVSALLLAAGLGLVACAMPARNVLRATIVEGLKELD